MKSGSKLKYSSEYTQYASKLFQEKVKSTSEFHERNNEPISLSSMKLQQWKTTVSVANLIVSLKDSTCETRKNIVYFILKSCFGHEVIKFWLCRYSNVMTSSNGQSWNAKLILLKKLGKKNLRRSACWVGQVLIVCYYISNINSLLWRFNFQIEVVLHSLQTVFRLQSL